MAGNERRKPTRAEITTKNKDKERRRAIAREERDVAGATWNELQQRHQECLSLLRIGVTPLTEIVKNRSVTSKLNVEQSRRVTETIKQLTLDVRHYTTELDKIYSQHKDKHGKERDDSLILESMRIGSLYLEWIQDWKTIVATTVTDTLNFIIASAESNQKPAQENHA